MNYEEYNGYQIGQRVVIRDWDDLASEFPVGPIAISCNGLAFVRDMRCLCGQVFTIRKLTAGRVFFFEESRWLFNYEMIRPYEEPIEGDPDVLQAFITGIEALL